MRDTDGKERWKGEEELDPGNVWGGLTDRLMNSSAWKCAHHGYMYGVVVRSAGGPRSP